MKQLADLGRAKRPFWYWPPTRLQQGVLLKSTADELRAYFAALNYKVKPLTDDELRVSSERRYGGTLFEVARAAANAQLSAEDYERTARHAFAAFEQLVRVSGSCSIAADWAIDREYVQLIDGLCATHGAEVSVLYHPYKRKFQGHDPTVEDVRDELLYMMERLNLVREELNAAAAERGGEPVKIATVILDAEQFELKPIGENAAGIDSAQRWNEAIREKHDLAYAVAKAFGRVLWYAKGAQVRGLYGYYRLGHMHGGERGPNGARLYEAWNWAATQDSLERCVEKNDGDPLTAWIACGGGTRPTPTDPKKTQRWDPEYEYDQALSYKLGRLVGDAQSDGLIGDIVHYPLPVRSLAAVRHLVDHLNGFDRDGGLESSS